MKKILMIVMWVSLFSIVACTGAQQGQGNNQMSGESGLTEGTDSYTVNGRVEKGPFIQGSVITLYELDASLNQTGLSYATETDDNLGSFTLSASLSSPFVEIMAQGTYFNEVSGEVTSGRLTLWAIADISEGTSININVLTTLSRNRIRELVSGGVVFSEAVNQAQREVLRVFNIDRDDVGDFINMSISSGEDRNAVLLAASAILQGDISASSLNELISKINSDISMDGTLDGDDLRDTILEHEMGLNLFEVRRNLESRYASLGEAITGPNFENFIDSDGDGRLNGVERLAIVIRGPDTLAEGSDNHLSVVLRGARPESDVVVDLVSSSPDVIALEPSRLIFTPSNYLNPQDVSISGVLSFGDTRDEMAVTITASMSGSDNVEQHIMFSEESPIQVHFSAKETRTGSDRGYISLAEAPGEEGDTLIIESDHPELITVDPTRIVVNSENYRRLGVDINGTYEFGDRRNGTPINFTISSESGRIEPLNFTLNFRDYREDEFVAGKFTERATGYTREIDKIGFIGINLYATSGYRIIRVTPTETIDVAGGAVSGMVDSRGSAARFERLKALRTAPDGVSLYILDSNKIRRMTIGGNVSTVYDSAPIFNFVVEPGTGDVIGISACKVVRINAGGTTTLAGGDACGTEPSDGIGAAALFVGLKAIAIDSSGSVYLRELKSGNSYVRKLTLRTGAVETIMENTSGMAGDYDMIYGMPDNIFIGSYSAIGRYSSSGERRQRIYDGLPVAARVDEFAINAEGVVYFRSLGSNISYLEHLGDY